MKYLYRGKPYRAKSKEDLLRRLGLSPYDKKNKAMVAKVQKGKGG